jgi:hypothetical protein
MHKSALLSQTIDQLHLIASTSKLAEKRSKRSAGESGLEGEVRTLLGKLFESMEHDPTSLERHTVWIESREPSGDDVSIHEGTGGK